MTDEGGVATVAPPSFVREMAMRLLRPGDENARAMRDAFQQRHPVDEERAMTMTSGDDRSISAGQRRCLAAAVACRDACLAAIAYCLQSRGDTADDSHVRLLRACAEECERAIPLLRDEEDGIAVMTAVAEAAGRCTREIVHRFPDDVQLQACAQICHECATGCTDAVTQTVPYDESVEETFPASDPPAR